MTTDQLYPSVITPYEPLRENEPGHWMCPYEWRDKFHEFLEAIGCDGYGYADNKTELDKIAKRDEADNAHYCIDTPLFTLRPYYWGSEKEIASLPNFVYKPWSYAIRWYKYPLRDAMANCQITDDEFTEMLETCYNYVDNLEAKTCGLDEPRALPAYRDKRTDADRCAAIWHERLAQAVEKFDDLYVALDDFARSLKSDDLDEIKSALAAVSKHTRVVVWDDELDAEAAEKLDDRRVRVTFVTTEHDIEEFGDDIDIFAIS